MNGDDFKKLIWELQRLNEKVSANTAKMDCIDVQVASLNERATKLSHEHTSLMEKGWDLEAAVDRLFDGAKDRLNPRQLRQLYQENARR